MSTARKVLFVAGAGRSGTSTLAGLLSRLGLHVPQPEVVADESNPKGFAEPQWVVDFHNRVLLEIEVQVSDSRPQAWHSAAERSADEATLEEVRSWLDPHFAAAPELIIKDPRVSWLLPLWREVSQRNGAVPVFATMLRPPAEVVGSKQKYYANTLGPAHLTASWVNMLLHTELLTRDAPRAFVRYADLLADARGTVGRVGADLDLAAVRDATEDDWAGLEGFIDPTLRRVGLDWKDLELPPRLEEIARAAWQQLNLLAEGEDSDYVRGELDGIREAYRVLYSESEAIAKSSAVAATRHLRRAHREQLAALQRPLTTKQRLADLIPHEARARIPAPLRAGLRRVLRHR